MAAEESFKIQLDYVHDGLSLVLFATRDESLFYVGDIASEHGEAPYQLKEGHKYEYEFSDSDFEFGEFRENIIQSRKKDSALGVIEPNIFVGTLNLPIRRKNTDKVLGYLPLEVRSTKTDYRDDYRTMLEFITERCVDLLLQSDSVVSQNLTTDFAKDANPEVLYQRFMFVKAIVGSEEFDEAVQRIVSTPVTRWAEQIDRVDVRRAGRFSAKTMRELVSGTNRIAVPDTHPLYHIGLKTIPDRISATRKTDSVDTPENRFVKHALDVFLKFCEDVQAAANEGSQVHQEAKRMAERIEGWLMHDLFRSLSPTRLLKLNSPVLQRKSGYREVFKVWLQFDLAAKLIWKGGDDVYAAGKKDVATLYEYWLFFKLLELLKSVYHIEPKDIQQLIKPDGQSMSLNLRQGRFTALRGTTERSGRRLEIRFSYNRSFTGKSDYPDSGSWTSTLRPDYTLSIWPADIKEDVAETEELITHIHFDAKYKVDINYKEMIASAADIADEEKTEYRKGNVKNADLLKMHAYKDAIRRTGGAYVLYPGTEKVARSGFHEIVPGLGAFPIRPTKDNSGIEHLRSFLIELTDHFVDRTSQREKMAYRTYDIHQDRPSNDFMIREPLPETYGDNRGLIPDETYVLVGYCKDRAHREWIKKHGLYNFRSGSERGSLVLDPKTVGARYLLLHTLGDEESGDLLKITSSGPKVYLAEDMIKRAYPNPNPHSHYLIVDVSENVEPELAGRTWAFKTLNGYESGRASALPFTISLAELMRVKV
jgi:predicted component of viral defense system (DUF524 family)